MQKIRFFTYFYLSMVQKSILYIIAIILLVGWAIGVFWFQVAGILIHILIVTSLIAAGIAFFREQDDD